MYCIDLTGKVAIVTGSRRGLGKEIALTLAKAGAHIIANSRSFRQGGDVLTREIETIGNGKIILVEGSVTEKTTAETITQTAVKHFNRIDILVNNAGVIARKDLFSIAREEWDHIISTNLTGTFLISQAAAQIMKKQNSGRIINIGSIAGKRGSAYQAHYAASKGGILNLTKTMAKELGEYNIMVNAIDPGRIKTDMLMKSIDTEKERWLKETSLNRLGDPEEVAGVVLFLASNLASYITGETIEVNGGVLMD